MVRKTLFTLGAVLALAGAAAAQEQTPRLVTMTGSATVQGTPDRAWVTVGVEARDPKIETAREQAAVAIEHIEQHLKSLGIPQTALRTSSFNVSQDWDNFQGRRTLRGYVVSNQIEVKVDDIAAVPAVLDGSIAAGANIIHGVRWDMKNRQTLERQALQDAFADARARAQVIATASGSRLGPVQGVQESRAGDVRPMSNVRFAAGIAATPPPPATPMPINPGEIEIRATVTVSFLIQG